MTAEIPATAITTATVTVTATEEVRPEMHTTYQPSHAGVSHHALAGQCICPEAGDSSAVGTQGALWLGSPRSSIGTGRDRGRARPIATTLALCALASCAQPVGPTVQVLPPAGKAFAAFEADERECSMHVNEQVKPMIDRAATAELGTAAVGTLLGAGLGAAIGGGRGAAIGAGAGAIGGTGVGADQADASQARIQNYYDNSYAACMTAHGDLVTAPPSPQMVVVSAPPTVIVQPAPYYVQPTPYVVVPAQAAPAR